MKLVTMGSYVIKRPKKILKPYLNRKDGYERVWLNGKNVYVHILMVNSFFANGSNGYKIIHIDKNKRHNDLRNFKFSNKND